MNPNQIERPTRLELSGHELLTELPRLQGQGATALAMVAICNARWRLTLHWPEPEQQILLPDELLKTGFSAKPH
jgi:hypothetical protein